MAAGAFLVMISNSKEKPVVPLISFVIPQKGRLDLLERTLYSFAKQEMGIECAHGPYATEVVVITQDELPDEACKLTERLLADVEGIDFQCIAAQDKGATISTLRNQAVRGLPMGGGWRFWTRDISLSSNWVRALTALLSSSETCVLVSEM